VYWKFLRAGAVSPFTGFRWSATGRTWVTAEHVTACATGIHACRSGDLPHWLSDELWAIELHEPVVETEHKVVATRARLLDQVEPWTAKTARALAEECVHRTAVHAAAELRAAGFGEYADRLAEQQLAGLAPAVQDIMQKLPDREGRRPAKLCGYVDDAVQLLSDYPVATIAYIAARAANNRSGPADTDYYSIEREWQAQWLVNTLGLDPAR
jgi:hypothetical protein